MFAKCRQEIDQKEIYFEKQCDKEMKSLSRGAIFREKQENCLKFVFEKHLQTFSPL